MTKINRKQLSAIVILTVFAIACISAALVAAFTGGSQPAGDGVSAAVSSADIDIQTDDGTVTDDYRNNLVSDGSKKAIGSAEELRQFLRGDSGWDQSYGYLTADIEDFKWNYAFDNVSFDYGRTLDGNGYTVTMLLESMTKQHNDLRLVNHNYLDPGKKDNQHYATGMFVAVNRGTIKNINFEVTQITSGLVGDFGGGKAWITSVSAARSISAGLVCGYNFGAIDNIRLDSRANIIFERNQWVEQGGGTGYNSIYYGNIAGTNSGNISRVTANLNGNIVVRVKGRSTSTWFIGEFNNCDLDAGIYVGGLVGRMQTLGDTVLNNAGNQQTGVNYGQSALYNCVILGTEKHGGSIYDENQKSWAVGAKDDPQRIFGMAVAVNYYCGNLGTIIDSDGTYTRGVGKIQGIIYAATMGYIDSQLSTITAGDRSEKDHRIIGCGAIESVLIVPVQNNGAYDSTWFEANGQPKKSSNGGANGLNHCACSATSSGNDGHTLTAGHYLLVDDGGYGDINGIKLDFASDEGGAMPGVLDIDVSVYDNPTSTAIFGIDYTQKRSGFQNPSGDYAFTYGKIDGVGVESSEFYNYQSGYPNENTAKRYHNAQFALEKGELSREYTIKLGRIYSSVLSDDSRNMRFTGADQGAINITAWNGIDAVTEPYKSVADGIIFRSDEFISETGKVTENYFGSRVPGTYKNVYAIAAEYKDTNPIHAFVDKNARMIVKSVLLGDMFIAPLDFDAGYNGAAVNTTRWYNSVTFDSKIYANDDASIGAMLDADGYYMVFRTAENGAWQVVKDDSNLPIPASAFKHVVRQQSNYAELNRQFAIVKLGVTSDGNPDENDIQELYATSRFIQGIKVDSTAPTVELDPSNKGTGLKPDEFVNGNVDVNIYFKVEDARWTATGNSDLFTNNISVTASDGVSTETYEVGCDEDRESEYKYYFSVTQDKKINLAGKYEIRVHDGTVSQADMSTYPNTRQSTASLMIERFNMDDVFNSIKFYAADDGSVEIKPSDGVYSYSANISLRIDSLPRPAGNSGMVDTTGILGRFFIVVDDSDNVREYKEFGNDATSADYLFSKSDNYTIRLYTASSTESAPLFIEIMIEKDKVIITIDMFDRSTSLYRQYNGTTDFIANDDTYIKVSSEYTADGENADKKTKAWEMLTNREIIFTLSYNRADAYGAEGSIRNGNFIKIAFTDTTNKYDIILEGANGEEITDGYLRFDDGYIVPKIVGVTFDDITKQYGTKTPAAGFVIDRILAGESEPLFDSVISEVLADIDAIPGGEYFVTGAFKHPDKGIVSLDKDGVNAFNALLTEKRSNYKLGAVREGRLTIEKAVLDDSSVIFDPEELAVAYDGQQHGFSPYFLDANGEEVDLDVTYTAQGGTYTTDVAPTDPGSYIVNYTLPQSMSDRYSYAGGSQVLRIARAAMIPQIEDDVIKEREVGMPADFPVTTEKYAELSNMVFEDAGFKFNLVNRADVTGIFDDEDARLVNFVVPGDKENIKVTYYNSAYEKLTGDVILRNVGTYYITLEYTNNDDHFQPYSKTYIVHISKADLGDKLELEYNMPEGGLVYGDGATDVLVLNGFPQDIQREHITLTEGIMQVTDYEYELQEDGTYRLSYTPTSAGTKNYTFRIKETENYNAAEIRQLNDQPIRIEVKRAEMSERANFWGITDGGEMPGINEVRGVYDGVTEYGLYFSTEGFEVEVKAGDANVDGNYISAVNAGTYNVTLTFKDPKGNYAQKTVSGKIIIDKAKYQGITVESDSITATYDGNAHKVEVRYPNGIDASDFEIVMNDVAANGAVDAGAYRYNIKLNPLDANYEQVVLTGDLNIALAAMDISGIIINNIDTLYDGKSHAPTLDNLPDGATYQLLTAFDRVNAGNTTIEIKIARKNYIPEIVTANVNIRPIEVDLEYDLPTYFELDSRVKFNARYKDVNGAYVVFEVAPRSSVTEVDEPQVVDVKVSIPDTNYVASKESATVAINMGPTKDDIMSGGGVIGDQEGQISIGLIVGCACGGVALIIVLILVVMQAKKRKREEEDFEENSL